MKKLLAALIFGVSILLLSCQEQPETLVHITVTDSNGGAVDNSTVRLFGQPSDSVYANNLILYDLETETNAEGVASFSFTDFYDQNHSGFAVLNVSAEKSGNSGTGKVKLVEGETIEETIILD